MDLNNLENINKELNDNVNNVLKGESKPLEEQDRNIIVNYDAPKEAKTDIPGDKQPIAPPPPKITKEEGEL